ncbi:MAG TPA: DUF6438 domain-containing protein [Saprospiraceae bacterium]
MTRPLRLTWTIVLFMTLCWTSSCSNNTPTERENSIKRIVFATGGCFGPCPVQVFDIDTSLSVKFKGVENTDFKGFYRGNVTQDFWDSLNMKFESIHYKQLDSAYDRTVDDLTTELMIYDKNNKIKYIYAQSSDLPDSVKNVYDWFLTRLDMIKLTKTQDSLTFPTYLDRPPIRTIIKFLPPKVDSDK